MTDSDREREDLVEFIASLDIEIKDIANIVIESNNKELGIEEIAPTPEDSEVEDFRSKVN